ncbi:MAG TPA: GTP cyclohydrolase II [Blastocatellia bacterium]|nr:GTP cyclohydrolase II [Blastocatellia bacterium]
MSVKEIEVEHRVIKQAEANLPTEFGDFRIIGFTSVADGEEFVVLTQGDLTDGKPVLVRIHSQCLTGDVFHSIKCDCRQQLHAALSRISKEGRGVLIYQAQEGRGIGIINKIRAYALQDQGVDTVEANLQLGFGADERDYQLCADIVSQLGIREVRMMSNNPDKIAALERAEIKITERVSLDIQPSDLSTEYLRIKKEKMGHLL